MRLTVALLSPRLEQRDDEIVLTLSDAHLPADARNVSAERDLAALAVLVSVIRGGWPDVRVRTRFTGARAEASSPALPGVEVETGCRQHGVCGEEALLTRATAKW